MRDRPGGEADLRPAVGRGGNRPGGGGMRRQPRLRLVLGLLLTACVLIAGPAFLGVALGQRDDGSGADGADGAAQCEPTRNDGEGDGRGGAGEESPDGDGDPAEGDGDPAEGADGEGEGQDRDGDEREAKERRKKRSRDDCPQPAAEDQVSAQSTSSLTPVADAHVRRDQPSSNFGGSSNLRVDGDPPSNAYLRFEVTVPEGERVTKATLRVFANQQSGSGISAHRVADNGWEESEITWDNAPAIGDKVGGAGGYSANTYVSVDVTAMVTASGPVSMAIKRSSSTSNTFSSRNAAANPPQLVVETESTAPPPEGAPVEPVADAHVRRDQPGANFGGSAGLRVDGDPQTNSYLRFDVSVPEGETVTKATLRVFANQSSGSGITVHGVADNSWQESQITWDNAPAIGASVGGAGGYSVNTYVEVDVTALVTVTGPVSMAIKRSSSTANTFNSRQAASNRPQLVVETEPGPPPPPPPPPETTSVAPVADAHVRQDQPGSNFGSAPALRVDGDPATHAYLRFEVDVPVGTRIRRATLRVFTTVSSTSGVTVHGVSDNTWQESQISWDNAPATGDRVGGSSGYAANSYVPIDVTALVTASGPVSMAVKRSSSTSNTFNSREAAANRPELVIETEPLPPPGSTVVYALGDGADGRSTAQALADYVKGQKPDRFFYLGDVYETGTAEEFATNYEPLYGSMASITDPVIGNHEYGNRHIGYYPYWQAKRGWTEEEADHRAYVDRSGWQIIAYSSETPDKTGEASWVASQVAKHTGTCRIVMSHRGRHVFADTSQDDQTDQEPIWSVITGKTAINVVGHSHVYGRLEPLEGVNVIVSGAGGHGLRPPAVQHHPVAAFKDGVATATRLVLRPGAADLQQVDSTGTIHDSATISCTPAG